MGRYSCGDQGISSGWADVYGAGLDCQYIDVTDVPAGEYHIRVSINRFHGIVESDYSDNEADVAITIPPAGDAGMPAPFDGGAPGDLTMPCAMATTGLTRNCGWTREPAARTCTAGAMVTIGCNAGCGPALGMCTGDSMIRVCAGDGGCTGLDGDPNRLGANDDACPPAGGGSNLCSQLTFRCPTSGRYTVMTAPYTSGMAFTCALAVR